MSLAVDPARLSAAQRSELIYAAARADLNGSLWRAALGGTDAAAGVAPSLSPSGDSGDFMGLAQLLMADATGAAAPRGAAGGAATDPLPTAATAPTAADAGSGQLRLGANAGHADRLASAAQRTGVPAAALAAIIDAEAAKDGEGRWRTLSRNPRSSAAGLGQFLSSTWISEAERAGTWLNQTARARGWLDAAGRVEAGARSALLGLRYEAEAAIEATADYAARTLNQLKAAGVAVGDSIEGIARTAYLGHHLGLGDAKRFLAGGLSEARAKTLLSAQVGLSAAAGRIAQVGDAVAAHRQWLSSYLDRRIQPQRWSA